jgi:hypothetical protein
LAISFHQIKNCFETNPQQIQENSNFKHAQPKTSLLILGTIKEANILSKFSKSRIKLLNNNNIKIIFPHKKKILLKIFFLPATIKICLSFSTSKKIITFFLLKKDGMAKFR